MLTTKVPPYGSSKAIPSMIGKRLDHCYGFTENVLLSPSADSPLLTDFPFHSRFRKECTQVRLFSQLVVTFIIDHPTVHQSSRMSRPCATQDQPIWPTSSLISRTRESRIPMPFFLLLSFSSAINPHLFATSSLAIIHPTNLARNSLVTAHLHNASKTYSMYQAESQSILSLTHLMNVPKRPEFPHRVKRS